MLYSDRFSCTMTEVPLNLTEVFVTLTEVFSCFFLSCNADARVKLAKTGHGPHSSTLVVICVVRLLFVFYALFVCKCVQPPGDNLIAVNEYIITDKNVCSSGANFCKLSLFQSIAVEERERAVGGINYSLRLPSCVQTSCDRATRITELSLTHLIVHST
jgi:hypothetical protein